MKLSTLSLNSLICAIAYACGVLARAQEECETEAFNNLHEVCRNESAFFVPAGSRNNTLLYRVSELSCDTCGKPLYDYLQCTDSQPNVANVNATCARNENGDFCYRTVFPLNGTIDISSVFQACSGTIFSLTNASCSEDCMNTLRSWTDVAGCCITSVYGLVNNTNVQLLLADRFWRSCQVDRPGACPEAFQSSNSSSPGFQSTGTSPGFQSTGTSPGFQSTGTSSPGFEATDASVQAAIANSFIICMLAVAVSLAY